MGLTHDSMVLLKKALSDNDFGFNGLRMCELGNQWLFLNPDSGIPHHTPSKGHFESLGVTHVSIDLNGDDGAIPLNLGEPLPEDFEVGFDVVTNFGTAEHVRDSFYQCLKNIHDLCRVGGVMVHDIPHKDNWPGHGFHYVTPESIVKLAELAGYEIQHLDTHFAMGNTKDGKLTRTILLKTREGFVSLDDFGKVPVYDR